MPESSTLWFLPARAAALALALTLASSCGGGGSDAGPGETRPAIRVPRTGRTVSVMPGDDGSLLRGVAWPTPRFSVGVGGKTMVDHLTGLMWTRSNTPLAECGWQFADGTGDQKTWEEALAYVACLNEKAYLGHSDWRMPNRWEMRSLFQNDGVASDPDARLQWLKDEGFQILSTDYWKNLTMFYTSTAMSYWYTCDQHDRVTMLWVADLNGEVYYDHHDNLTPFKGVWPVRDAEGVEATARLPATGLTACYGSACDRVDCAGTGQDAETRKGVAWPNPRFATNEDTSITDRLTGLIWAPNGNLPSTEPRGDYAWSTWPEALAVVEQLNASGYLGRDDWRLPNINELTTLALADLESAAIYEQLGSRYGLNVGNTTYWSSTWTTRVWPSSTDEMVWTMDMVWGNQELTAPTDRGQVLPVRGGP